MQSHGFSKIVIIKDDASSMAGILKKQSENKFEIKKSAGLRGCGVPSTHRMWLFSDLSLMLTSACDRAVLSVDKRASKRAIVFDILKPKKTLSSST